MQSKNYLWYYAIGIIVIVLIVAGYFYWKSTQNQASITEKTDNNSISVDSKAQKIDELIPPDSLTKLEEKDNSKKFSNSDHSISLIYPEGWEETDLGGEKNTSEILTRENIVYLYRPDTLVEENNPTSSLVNVKLIRFYLGDEHKIDSSDNWYKYIKEKIDEYIADPKLSANYKLLDLQIGDKIDSQWTIVEDYIENEVERGKDYYIFNDREMYQFVTHAPEKYYGNYFPQIETIVKSFEIK